MKYYTSNVTLKYPWDHVVTAFWQRYPNPYSKHVLSEDTVVRCVANGLLSTKRFITKTNPVPKWGRKIIHSRDVSIVEESTLDRESRTFVTYTRNVGLLGFMTVDEKVSYRQDPDNPNYTEVKREAWINSQMMGLSTVLQKFGLERFRHNAVNATKGFLTVLSRLYPVKLHEIDGGHHHKISGKAITDIVAKKFEKVKEAGHRQSKDVL